MFHVIVVAAIIINALVQLFLVSYIIFGHTAVRKAYKEVLKTMRDWRRLL